MKKTLLTNVKTYIKKPWVIALLAIVLLIAFFSFRGGPSEAKEEIIVVKAGTVQEGVSVTGKVKAAQAVDLSFERGGKVTRVTKEVGERVTAGETIVQLDNASAAADLAQAQASLQFQQSRLDELEAGTRPEQLDITKAKVLSAKSDLDIARLSFVSSLQNSYSVADDSVRNKVDVFFANPRSSNPQLVFTSTITSETSIESGRVEVENRLNKMKNNLTGISTTSDLSLITASLKQDLGEIKLFLDNLSLTVNALAPTQSLSQTTITTWKADMSSARTSLNTAITTLLSAESNLRSAETAYDLANRQLTLDSSGVVSQQIKAQRAQVAQAQATVSSRYAEYTKTYIKAPISGIVTKQDTRVGETAPANVTVVSIISEAQFEIEANIAEADIAKIKAGQEASVTLDAYGSDDVFKARVVTVAPAETVIDGVPTYKTTFQFETADERIKSGMTANVDIRGERRENVLSVPQRAMLNRGGDRYVRVKTGETITEVKVKTGIRGEDGAIEITEGLREGDNVIVSQP
jgi:HlyD family secretion protein